MIVLFLKNIWKVFLLPISALLIKKRSKEREHKKGKIIFFINQHSGLIQISGNSMLPVIEDGWQVKVKMLNGTDITTGQIYLFLDRIDRIACHRAVLKIGNFVFLKGDNQIIPEVALAADIIGIVTEIHDHRGNKINT